MLDKKPFREPVPAARPARGGSLCAIGKILAILALLAFGYCMWQIIQGKGDGGSDDLGSGFGDSGGGGDD